MSVRESWKEVGRIGRTMVGYTGNPERAGKPIVKVNSLHLPSGIYIVDSIHEDVRGQRINLRDKSGRCRVLVCSTLTVEPGDKVEITGLDMSAYVNNAQLECATLKVMIPPAPHRRKPPIPSGAVFANDLGVIDCATGTLLLKVFGAPLAGQYRYDPNTSGGVYEFSPQDAGKAVDIGCSYYLHPGGNTVFTTGNAAGANGSYCAGGGGGASGVSVVTVKGGYNNQPNFGGKGGRAIPTVFGAHRTGKTLAQGLSPIMVHTSETVLPTRFAAMFEKPRPPEPPNLVPKEERKFFPGVGWFFGKRGK